MQREAEQIAVYSTMAAIFTALVIWIAVSTMDYNDAQRAEIEYCQHVRDGLLPDWKGTYKPGCEGEEEL
ncbi:MAG: hypothetical protein IPN63_07685 [Gammaproteobacteria bacterium]|nr:hypothetical protein [Gammaproteobacteria bacterium]